MTVPRNGSVPTFHRSSTSLDSIMAGRISRLLCHKTGVRIMIAMIWGSSAPLMEGPLCITSFEAL